MNTVPIESETGLLQLLKHKTLFRGHSNATWKLESTLERAARNKFGESFRQHLRDFEASLIDDFIDRCHRLKLGEIYGPNKLPHESNTLEWLSIMQHYGCPSRLIDFTDDIWVALHFALSDTNSSDSFAIYGLQTSVGDETGNKLPKDAQGKIYRVEYHNRPNVNELIGLAINFRHFQSPYGAKELGVEWQNPMQNYGWDTPKFQNIRIQRQRGMFLYQVWPDGQLEQIPEITKYTVPASFRGVAKAILERSGIKYSREFLFPEFRGTQLCPQCMRVTN